MEACATSHFWGRFAQRLGHEVRLIPPIYVKPFVKRQKNDAADAAAIAEAALRPNLHYVAIKSAEHQARAVAFRTHQSFVRQRTQLIPRREQIEWRSCCHVVHSSATCSKGGVACERFGVLPRRANTAPWIMG